MTHPYDSDWAAGRRDPLFPGEREDYSYLYHRKSPAEIADEERAARQYGEWRAASDAALQIPRQRGYVYERVHAIWRDWSDLEANSVEIWRASSGPVVRYIPAIDV